jgi:hypothetical protein
MADDNKPMKYMRYAIGEIVLVVIGILIALSINNWNEEPKNLEPNNMNLFMKYTMFRKQKRSLDEYFHYKSLILKT